ncbi:hypothetical protein U1Q18_052706 [Sarracenia purpurea var. burkii]
MEAGQLPILPDLLRLMPNLKVLRFNKDCNKPCSSCLWDVVPESVPECLLLCLETIEFSGFGGCKEEMKLVSYLLVNSKVLKKFILNSWTKDKKKKTNIRRLPRGSNACQIEICYLSKCKCISHKLNIEDKIVFIYNRKGSQMEFNFINIRKND